MIGCKKEQPEIPKPEPPATYCWECNEHMTLYDDNDKLLAEQTMKKQYCNKTEFDIQNIQDNVEYSKVTDSAFSGYSHKTISGCVKQ